MGLLRRLLEALGIASVTRPAPRFDLTELARRLSLTVPTLTAIRPSYREFEIPKRSGGMRTIFAPEPALKSIQRTILQRLLSKLAVHEAATGFERGKSVVANALPHVGRAVVVRLDLRDFFASTSAQRVREYFRFIGWDKPSADLLTRLVTYKGGLPQGAPTSPRLSNLLNYRLDAALAGLARKRGAVYTRYADDITFSFGEDNGGAIRSTIQFAARILQDAGYEVHRTRKLRIARQHERQVVTGLVVNSQVALPRSRRRWLRAVEHHVAAGRPATLSPIQLQGWDSLRQMIESQSGR